MVRLTHLTAFVTCVGVAVTTPTVPANAGVKSEARAGGEASPSGRAEHRATGNPDDIEVAEALTAAAREFRIPLVLLEGLAWRESHWRQWDDAGTVNEAGANHVGLLGVWAGGRVDAKRLRSDWRFNIREGARQLQACWFRAPIIGDGRLEDSRDILESWYYALGRYGNSAQSDDSLRFADSVLDAVAAGGEGRWEPIRVNRLDPRVAAAWGNVFGAPVPWHWGDVPPRRPTSPVVVSLDLPYLSQVYDTPDDFKGGGACGPTSMTMVLAYYKKVQPQPILVTDGYRHTTDYGALVPALQDAVCEPNRGAIHAKMLNYLRPMFPGVAIFYNERATLERVKRELDAGRPVILGTEVTHAGHIMVARGYLADGRLIVNDPAGDYYQAARVHGPDSLYAQGARRYCNGDGAHSLYDWDALLVRWVMTVGPKEAGLGDRPEDE